MIRVPYDDLRTGDIGFVAGKGAVSKTISRLTKRRDLGGFPTPSHAFVLASRTQVVEALEKTKVRSSAVYAAAFGARRATAFRPPGSPEVKRTAMRAFLREYTGASYGWLQIVGFLPVLWARKRLDKEIRNPVPGGEICSEIALLWLWRLQVALEIAGEKDAARSLEWVDLLSRDTTDPALLMSECLRHLVGADA